MADTHHGCITDGGSRGKRCAECEFGHSPTFEFTGEADYVALLHHYLDEHPNSSIFSDVVESCFVEVECEDCGQPFWSPVSLTGDGKISAEIYCPDCTEGNPVRRLMGREITPEEFVEKEGEPLEDELGGDEDE